MYPFTKLRDRRILKVRIGVGVGPMEFQLKARTPRRRYQHRLRLALHAYILTFEDPREEVRVGVGVVECGLKCMYCMLTSTARCDTICGIHGVFVATQRIRSERTSVHVFAVSVSKSSGCVKFG